MGAGGISPRAVVLSCTVSVSLEQSEFESAELGGDLVRENSELQDLRDMVIVAGI